MIKVVYIFVWCVVINRAATQTLNHTEIATSTTNTTEISHNTTDSKWDELLPALNLIKNTSVLKKDRLLNVVRLIKNILSQEMEKNQCDEILDMVKDTNESNNPDIVTDVKDAIPKDDSRNNETEIINGEQTNVGHKNKTAEFNFNKTLAKISAAIDKVKHNNVNPKPVEPIALQYTPIFKVRKNNENDVRQEAVQAERNSVYNNAMFNIPCQRAADILEETSKMTMPKEACCDFNLNSILNDAKLNSDHLPFQIVPDSVSYVDSEDTIAVLFKPKTVSLMQVYGNILKNITMTVLVPYHVSKMAL